MHFLKYPSIDRQIFANTPTYMFMKLESHKTFIRNHWISIFTSSLDVPQVVCPTPSHSVEMLGLQAICCLMSGCFDCKFFVPILHVCLCTLSLCLSLSLSPSSPTLLWRVKGTLQIK